MASSKEAKYGQLANSHFLFDLACSIYIASSTILVYATADEVDAYMFYRCFLFVFFVFVLFFFLLFAFSIRHKSTRQPFSGTAGRISMKLLPNDSGKMEFASPYPNGG